MKTPQPILVSELFLPLLDGLISLLLLLAYFPEFASNELPSKFRILVQIFTQHSVGSLSEDEWAAPTACTPWSVKDICVHLLGGDLGNLSWKRDDYSVFTTIDSWDHLVGLLNEHNQLWVKATQHISPRLIIEMLRFSGDKVSAYFQSLDPFVIGVSVDWVSSNPAPVWLDLAREYTERWHHQQHIRDAVNKPGFKDPKYLAPILDAFILALPRTFDGFQAEQGASLQIKITGNVEKEWVLQKEDNQWKLFEGNGGEHQTSITMEDDLAWRVFTKGILKDEARKLVEIRGNQELGGKILETVSIIA